MRSAELSCVPLNIYWVSWHVNMLCVICILRINRWHARSSPVSRSTRIFGCGKYQKIPSSAQNLPCESLRFKNTFGLPTPELYALCGCYTESLVMSDLSSIKTLVSRTTYEIKAMRRPWTRKRKVNDGFSGYWAARTYGEHMVSYADAKLPRPFAYADR